MSKNICSLCKRSYDYQVSVRISPNGDRVCLHDNEFEQGIVLDLTDHRIKKSLPKNQKLVKGRDGISRVVEYEKKRK